MVFLIILGVFLWIAVALWPAFIARNKGYSFILFWILGWFISWILTLLLALVVPRKSQPPLYATPAERTAPSGSADNPTQSTGPLDQ